MFASSSMNLRTCHALIVQRPQHHGACVLKSSAHVGDRCLGGLVPRGQIAALLALSSGLRQPNPVEYNPYIQSLSTRLSKTSKT